MSRLVQRFIYNAAKNSKNGPELSIAPQEFIISKDHKDARLKLLKLCKRMMTNSLYFSCELYLGIPRAELHYMMKEKFRLGDKISDPREIDMFIVKAQMLEAEVRKCRMTRDRALNFFNTVFKPPKKTFLENFLTKEN